MSTKFQYKPFVADSGTLGGKIPVVDDVLPSHERDYYPTTSLDEKCKRFDFLTDRNYCVELGPTCLALKLKLVKGRSYETYNNEEVKRENQKEAKIDEEAVEEEKEEATFFSLLM